MGAALEPSGNNGYMKGQEKRGLELSAGPQSERDHQESTTKKGESPSIRQGRGFFLENREGGEPSVVSGQNLQGGGGTPEAPSEPRPDMKSLEERGGGGTME